MCTDNINKKNYFNFVFTNDGSTGLFNNEVNDVYHSVFGAKEEAEQKFIKPLEFEKNFLNSKELKVLDICFGIGYNTKAFLKKLILTKYKGAVSIDIIEQDKNIVTISPFIKDGFFKNFPRISYALSKFLINDIYDNKETVNNIVLKAENKKFFETFYTGLLKKYENKGYSYDPARRKNRFLHNIYYQCISLRKKKTSKGLNLNKLSLQAHYNDARKVIKQLDCKYNIMFLDAFTPSKLPALWTLEFFKELYRLSDENCMLVTYSNSAAVRHAMIEAGYAVGKLFDKNNRPCGTIAPPNEKLIKNKLDDYDIGLMKTRAGIYYRDKNLDAESKEILSAHDKEKSESKLESSSQYIKNYKRYVTEKINAKI